MSSNVASASLLDNVRYNLFHFVPYLLRGIFTRNRRWVRWLNHLQRDPASVQFLGSLREKYRCDFLAVRMLTDRVLLVFDPGAVRHILDHSPAIYAETKGKFRGMSHFQPHALTISHGEAWNDRRKFANAVLKPRQGVHPFAEDFLSVIRQEIVRRTGTERGGLCNWEDFSGLFEDITLRVIFGDAANDDGIMALLKNMMQEANNPILAGKKSKYFDDFYRKIADRLKSPPDRCLASLCRTAPRTEMTRVENQIPHWLFAMNDTLAINTVAALVLISAHPEADRRVRSEIAWQPPKSAQNIDRLKFLEGCIQEAMRLWPSTLMLMRQALVEDHIGDTVIPAGTQLLIHNGFNHRDGKTHSFADRFDPAFWLDKSVDYHFNHLSNGPQVCAGKDLALYLAKAVLAILLSENRFTIQHPVLAPESPLPFAFDHFSLQCVRVPIH